MVNMFRALMARMTLLVADESGMSTVEYSIVHYYNHPIRSDFGETSVHRKHHSVSASEYHW